MKTVKSIEEKTRENLKMSLKGNYIFLSFYTQNELKN